MASSDDTFRWTTQQREFLEGVEEERGEALGLVRGLLDRIEADGLRATVEIRVDRPYATLGQANDISVTIPDGPEAS